jgi:non-heme chloroperoxidase
MAKAPSVPDDATVTKEERRQVTRANKSGKTPVVFVHGLWLLPASRDRWVKLFERNGYCALGPGWPDDPDSVTEAKARPEVFARKGIGDIADHYEAIISKLDTRPP